MEAPPEEKRRTRLSFLQLVKLEETFAVSWYPSWADKDALAREFELTDWQLTRLQINVWFCNRRTKAKREKEHMPDSFIPSHAQAALKSRRAAPPSPTGPPMRDPTPDSPQSRAEDADAPRLAIRTDDDPRRPDDRRPAPVSAESAASIQAQLSSSLSAALLGSSSAAYRTPYVARPGSRDRSPSPARPRHRSNSTGARHSPYAARQHTYPFTRRSRSRSPPPPTLAPIGRPDYAQALPPFHAAAGLPPALPAPPNTKPLDSYSSRYAGDFASARPPLLAHRASDPQVSSPAALSPSDDPRKGLQPIHAPPHVGALQSAPHVGAFHSMPVVGVFQGTAPPPTELPISVWQAHPLVRTRARITREQLRALEALFAKTWFPTSQQRAEAASVTGMREYSVTVWFQNRRSKAKKEGLQPPEGDRSKLRKDKGPKRDLGTHVFEVGSSRHPEPIGTGTSYPPAAPPAATPTQNLVWLEDARSRGRVPAMKPNGPAENAPDRPGSPRSWTDAEAEAESDAEMEGEAGQPQYQLRDSRVPPGYGRAYTHGAPAYPPREAHPSYASVGDTGKLEPARRGSGSTSPRAALTRSRSPQNSIPKAHSSYPHSSSEPRRRNSAHSHPPESEDDALGSDPSQDDPEPDDRPAKRSRRENEHAREDVGSEDDATRHRPTPERTQTTG
ncbi:hypothetical protein FRC10_009911 [Ceratobasidium sp. 414]|nr:hypothetical protein FRC10_009911 [Ceratobasidium sp. 414]